jgi:hypothetical protein
MALRDLMLLFVRKSSVVCKQTIILRTTLVPDPVVVDDAFPYIQLQTSWQPAHRLTAPVPVPYI